MQYPITVAWVTRSERPKGVNDEVKQGHKLKLLYPNNYAVPKAPRYIQGGRCCASAGSALTERSGTPNIRYVVAKLSIVTIYTLFKRLSQGFER